MTRRGLLGMLGGAVVLLSAGCGVFSSNYHYRYRMTVEIDTPQGLKTGSAVHEQIVTKSNVNVGDISAKRGIYTQGEAVAVDLPGGQTLFALIPDSELVQSVLDPAWQNDWVESARRIKSGDTPDEPLAMTPGKPADQFARPIGYPMLVHFRDITDPGTVEEVDPANLHASFGPGVTIRRITVEITDEPRTTGIKDKLRWLEAVGKERGSLLPNPPRLLKDTLPIQLVSSSNFSTELHK